MSTLSNAAPDHRRRHPVCAVAATILFFAACGGAFAQTQATATVYVAPATGKPPAGVCTTTSNHYVCVDPDPVKTGGATGTDVKIVWKLASAGWTFVQNRGIDIQNMKNWRMTEREPKQYTATNKKEDGALYKYDINVTNGTVTLKWDPTIMN